MTIKERIHQVAEAGERLRASTSEERGDLLRRIARGLVDDWADIEDANRRDLQAAEAGGLAPALVSRLAFGPDKRDAVVSCLKDLVALPDPKGQVLEKRELDTGLVLTRVSVPLGVIGMVFEARPDALVQIVGLCVKSGNAIVLKGGSEALGTNKALVASIRKSCASSPIGSGWLLLLENREEVGEMLACRDDIDLVIPRGSNAFVRWVMDHTEIPVLGHASGICHVYVDDPCDLSMAAAIVFDAKTNAPSACNAVETILVHRAVAKAFLPLLAEKLAPKHVVLHGDQEVCSLIPSAVPYRDGDWDKEYLALEANVHVVDSEDEAIAHINAHGSHHTDAIVTSDPSHAGKFEQKVDSASVFVNASTRFADGYRYGLGAEVGISTGKIHARGPVGLAGLMTYRWVLEGSGQVVATYMGPHAKPFTHKELV